MAKVLETEELVSVSMRDGASEDMKRCDRVKRCERVSYDDIRYPASRDAATRRDWLEWRPEIDSSND